MLIDLPKRGIHLAFALLLAYLLFPAFATGRAKNTTGLRDLVVGLLAVGCALYLPIAYTGIVDRNGILLVIPVGPWSIPIEYFLGGCGIICLLEATRRAIGLPLVVVASSFLIYSVFGQTMPDVISHKGLSLARLIG